MEQFLIDAFKSLGPAALPVGLLWWGRKEMREDLLALRAKNDALQQQIIDLTKESIKADLTNTLVLEKIADKVGV